MNVLLIGSGGREHALAWKLAESPLLDQLWIAPGNPGTARLGSNVPISVTDVQGLLNFSRSHAIDLAVIGPEAALAAGLSDALKEAGIAVFGPTRAAAQIETSKVFAKSFMQRHGIPTARFATFTKLEPAFRHLDRVDYPVVIKASGLAAGKGVIIPANIREARSVLESMLEGNAFGEAGSEVVIEERLEGREVSLLAFSDGQRLSLMPPAQDHKRLLEDNRGPNTGGMGAYAPTPLCPPEMQAEIMRTILQPAVDGLRSEGMPFCGVLYAGIMLTAAGPRVLEFNARFGDPETQAILPLLATDLLKIMKACACGELEQVNVEWTPGSAVCVVMAAADYPVKNAAGIPITGLDALPASCQVFHAGTAEKDGMLLAVGGRILGVTGAGVDLPDALREVYEGVRQIHFQGAFYRRDIAGAALEKTTSAYSRAGVDIDAGAQAVSLISQSVKSTYTPRVLGGLGSFGGLFDAGDLQSMREPVLVASTDGVGTKVKLAASLGRYHGVGMDIVNHCINDILVQGAKPLFFLDYFASSRLKPQMLAEIVAGMAEACRAAGCVLLGGETAEMPGVYETGEFDVAGTIVGCVERSQILPRKDIRAGDLLVGIRSSGPHTNGYSLLRRVFSGVSLQMQLPGTEQTLEDALLEPHRSYLPLLHPLLKQPDSPVKALAHLTGGGFLENIPRILPEGYGAHIHRGSWPVLPIFVETQKRGQISDEEMHRVFNMGIGMIVVVSAKDAGRLQQAIPEETWVVGEVVEDTRKKVKLA